ncbi:hypothetical protein [Phaeobacter gallaeciensis]|uniref:hypothetical protein n=1 Tax=Phaeobacter gallaeciensis TaxID=60890 RepID=UPI00237F9138|nr:hypothetical protein [Phaeobacter gallaeciensis]MDE4059776.1 hypothetical protein [Phaeobacter gallaeciensis]MDE4122587.1 hypothetical protein [Phaeobacter gallaeciensis]MDE4127264.1 hypothetical protein [Phaeobacter gallaeciensis]
MRIYDNGTSAILAARGGLVPQRLVWIKARNRSTGAVEAMGLCSGLDDLTLTLGGEVRTYLAVGALLQSEPITAGSGLAVRVHQLQLAAVAPEVEGLVKGYDTRFAPVEIHRVLFAPNSNQMAGVPHPVFRGMVNSIDFPTVEPGGSPSCTVEVVSETRVLTRTLATKKSDDSHKARGGDRFRRYGDISGAVPVYWGELRISPPADPAPAPETPPDENLGR